MFIQMTQFIFRDGKLLSSGALPGSYNMVPGGLREGTANMPGDPSVADISGVRDISKTFENKEVEFIFQSST